MKKRIIFLLAVFVCFTKVYAQAKDLSKDKYYSLNLAWYSTHYVTPQCIYEVNNEEETYTKLKRNRIYLDKTGYYHFDDKVFIPGLMAVKFDLKKGRLFNDSYAEERGVYFNDSFGAKYSASSSLSEKTKNGIKKYDAENLGRFAFSSTSHYESLSWNFNSIPWVEGEKGYGIGSTIRISTKEYFDTLCILNGYVNIEKLDLYKKNSRVKVFNVKDLDNNLEYRIELEDIVEFQYLYLDEETKNVELTIVEVYKGDKWADTCVQGIVPMVTSTTVDNSNQQKYSMFGSEKAITNTINNYTNKYSEIVNK